VNRTRCAGQWPEGRATTVGQEMLSGQANGKGMTMGRIIKALVVLVIFGFIALTVYAYLGDLSPIQGQVTKPVVLNEN
jgi:hypothetical protein